MAAEGEACVWVSRRIGSVAAAIVVMGRTREA